MLLGEFPSHSLHNADNFVRWLVVRWHACWLCDQQFGSFHKSLRRRVEEIRYVLEKVETYPGLPPHIAVFYPEAELEQHSTLERFLDKCFRFAEERKSQKNTTSCLL